MMFLALFSVLAGGHAGFFFKNSNKGFCVFISKREGDVVDGICCIYQ